MRNKLRSGGLYNAENLNEAFKTKLPMIHLKKAGKLHKAVC